jgi:hypothetical protein
MKPAGLRLAGPLALAAWVVIAAGSCTEINGAADHVAAIEFTKLPYPAVVSGDTLRDSLGVVAPLRALVFNTAGGEIEGAGISYLALDTGITISAGGIVTATRRSGLVGIMASTSALQTKRADLIIARRPDSAAIAGASRDTIFYDLLAPDGAAHTSDPMTVRVVTGDSAGGVTFTQGWIVSYQVAFRNAIIAPGDTSTVFLRGDGTQRSQIDTTSVAGTAERRLRLFLAGSGLTTEIDSAIVTATVRHKGQHVRGSPLRFVILLRKKP